MDLMDLKDFFFFLIAAHLITSDLWLCEISQQMETVWILISHWKIREYLEIKWEIKSSDPSDAQRQQQQMRVCQASKFSRG